MSCYTIYYENGAKKMRAILTAAEYRNLRNTERQKAIVRQVRNEVSSRQPSPIKGEGVDTNAKRKAKLLQMNYSCIPSDNMKLKGCTTPSNTIGMDVDLHRDDYATEEDYQKALAEIPEKVLAKKDELGLLMLERSATKGYHLVFRRKAELSQEDNLLWASKLLGVDYDKGAKDITRVFFTTTASEEDLLFLDDELFSSSPALPR